MGLRSTRKTLKDRWRRLSSLRRGQPRAAVLHIARNFKNNIYGGQCPPHIALLIANH